MKSLLMSIFNYRGFIGSSIKRDFQSRYKTSMLGAAWLVLQPLAMIIVYTVIFAEVMRARMPGDTGPFAYSIYICSGLLTWGFFAELVTRLQTVFVDNANFLKKINFPRICLPVISLGASFINFLIIFSLYLLFLLFTGNFPGIYIFGIIPLLIVQIIFSLGLGVILGVLNVFFRDVSQFMNILLQFWFWFTPIIYIIDILPKWASKWLMLNPMTGLIVGYQNIFVRKQWPDWSNLYLIGALSVILLIVALHLFRKHSGDMVDEL
ncbi:lipopolysaccharide transport system permease protein [Izhakiella capsodis]|uniref:Transport permease protein n=1 Tax=Izhakiella capsodis TaxID=1367852 RepID=A0A1I5AJT6_9GAMM|nr:ABC transporter permease [Izhakiella capsodis]SFN62683.1 lipopolysaccharide transport system permease protein [Izhakiella capsodis]